MADTSGAGFLARRRRYRRLMYGVLAVGVFGFIVASELDEPLVAVAVYWGGIAGFVAVWKRTDTTLHDERERAIERWASTLTLLIAAIVLVSVGPTLYALEAASVYDPPATIEGILFGYALLFGVFAIVYGARRFTP